MKCHILFSGKNKENISRCRLQKILPRVLSVKRIWIHIQGKLLLHRNIYIYFPAHKGKLLL